MKKQNAELIKFYWFLMWHRNVTWINDFKVFRQLDPQVFSFLEFSLLTGTWHFRPDFTNPRIFRTDLNFCFVIGISKKIGMTPYFEANCYAEKLIAAGSVSRLCWSIPQEKKLSVPQNKGIITRMALDSSMHLFLFVCEFCL